MTRHYFGFSILILFLTLAQISAIEPTQQRAETGSVQKVVPSVVNDGYKINPMPIPSIIQFADLTNNAPFKSSVLENNVAYLRVGEVQKNLAEEIQSAQSSLAATNKIDGTILDLRFANGDDSDAAKAAADLFAGKKLPLAILVNAETRGAAAMLATDLREARDGLIFGGATAELKPDIAVTVKIGDEKMYLENPYAAPAQDGTNAGAGTNSFSPFIDHTSEADLVREKIKDGDEDEDSAPSRPTEPQKPFIHDPVLARAVDLIKALALVRQSHA
jgi:Peptidase family S41